MRWADVYVCRLADGVALKNVRKRLGVS